MKTNLFLKKHYLLFVHAAALAPGLYLLFRFLSDQLTANPIQDVTLHTGKYALIMLMTSLSMTPLKTITGWSWASTARKWFGLYAFFYAATHFLIFIGLDFGFAWEFIWQEITSRNYLIVGASALIILSLMAATSFQWWVNLLGTAWTWLHRLIYAGGILVVLHFAWVRKGDLFSLQGDVLEPFLYGLLFITLMVLRIPVIRRKIANARRKQQRKKNQAASGNVVVRRTSPAKQGVQSE